MSDALEQDYPGVSLQPGTLPPKTLWIKKFFVFQHICPFLNIFVFLSRVMNHEGVTSHSMGPLSLIQSLNQQNRVCVPNNVIFPGPSKSGTTHNISVFLGGL